MLLLSECRERDQLLSAKKLARRLNVSLRTIYRMVARGDLPSPRRLGPKQVGWVWEEVLDWINRSRGQPQS